MTIVECLQFIEQVKDTPEVLAAGPSRGWFARRKVFAENFFAGCDKYGFYQIASDGSSYDWSPSLEDMLADDWETVWRK